MSFWVWWLVPVVATAIALVIVALRNRERKPADADSGMAELERFREAMQRPLRKDGHTYAQRSDPWSDDTGEIPIVRDNWSK